VRGTSCQIVGEVAMPSAAAAALGATAVAPAVAAAAGAVAVLAGGAPGTAAAAAAAAALGATAVAPAVAAAAGAVGVLAGATPGAADRLEGDLGWVQHWTRKRPRCELHSPVHQKNMLICHVQLRCFPCCSCRWWAAQAERTSAL